MPGIALATDSYYSENLYPLRNHILPNEATVGVQEPHAVAELGSM